jgi:hypothetical protein
MNKAGFENTSFIKLSERENIFVYKFTPAENGKLDKWYNRYLDIVKVGTDISRFRKFVEKYKFEYLLSDHKIQHKLLSEEYNNQKYHLYSIKKDSVKVQKSNAD